ncbi:MAG: tetratricopeptide repeat protein [Candidatus Acidiferrales bacterium]
MTRFIALFAFGISLAAVTAARANADARKSPAGTGAPRSKSVGAGESPARAKGQSEQLGRVSFPVSCTAPAQGTFNTGVALLHSFQYQQAEQTFTQVAQQDPKCAMAYWGEAMSLYHQLWDWPNADTLKQGLADTIAAQKLRAPTDRERLYIVAAGVFFQDNANLSRASRVKAYSDWMGRIFAKYPDDVNAGAFYALSLITLQGKPADELANRKQAIAILDKLMAVAPNNPGVLHYLIHAADTPELAPQGLEAARRYARIAPDSSHALHMPSHIFVRLGLWQEAIQSNLAAAAVAAKATQAGQGDSSYQFHAMDFLDYAYLQSGQVAKARALVDELKSVSGATAEDIARNTAWLAARNALDLHQWKQAAALPIPAVPLESQDTTYWARAIGAARTGDIAGARSDIESLAKVMAAQGDYEEKMGDAVPSGESVQQQETDAWLDDAQGNVQAALKTMRAAADREDSSGVDLEAMPAHEMLGDMLREMKKPVEALAEYKKALVESPNRFDSLYGAAQAAQLSGKTAEARVYLARLVKVCGPDADRPELTEARAEIAKR